MLGVFISDIEKLTWMMSKIQLAPTVKTTTLCFCLLWRSTQSAQLFRKLSHFQKTRIRDVYARFLLSLRCSAVKESFHIDMVVLNPEYEFVHKVVFTFSKTRTDRTRMEKADPNAVYEQRVLSSRLVWKTSSIIQIRFLISIISNKTSEHDHATFFSF